MTSIHSVDRAKERFGFNHHYAEHFLENAIRHGKGSHDFKSTRERTWLDGLARDGCRAVAYNGSCVIISNENICVTVYELPTWFGKKRMYDSDKRYVRNAVKYSRMNVHYTEEM